MTKLKREKEMQLEELSETLVTVVHFISLMAFIFDVQSLLSHEYLIWHISTV